MLLPVRAWKSTLTSLGFRQTRYPAKFKFRANRGRTTAFEALEGRAMLSATATFNSVTGALTVTGDDFSQALAIETTGSDVLVTLDSTPVQIYDENENPINNLPASSVTSISVTGGAGNDTINLSGVTAAFSSLNNSGVITISGGAGDDHIYGSVWNDSIEGGADDDILEGGGSADKYVFAGTESLCTDTIVETSELGANDTLDFSQLDFSTGPNDFAAGVTVSLKDATVQPVIDHNGKSLTLDLTNSASKLAKIVGTAFNDTLTGNLRQNTLTGGSGNDAYVFKGTLNPANSDADWVVEQANGGNDTLDFSLLSTQTSGLGLNLGVTSGQTYIFGWALYLTLTNGEIENVVGTANADTINGNSVANMLVGGAGIDNLFGSGGDDTIYGGDGDDFIDGGSGDDVLIGGNGDDEISGGNGDDWLDGGASGTYVDYRAGDGGNDRYVFAWTEGQPSLGVQNIEDSQGYDTLDFSAYHGSGYYDPTPPNGSLPNGTLTFNAELTSVTYTGIDDFERPATLPDWPDEPDSTDEILLYEDREEGPRRTDPNGAAPLVAMNAVGSYVTVFTVNPGVVFVSIGGNWLGERLYAYPDHNTPLAVGIDDDANFAIATDAQLLRYNAVGDPQGVFNFNVGGQVEAFSMNGDGLYVVAWVDGNNVRVQRFHEDDTPFDEEPLIASTDSAYSKSSPSIAMANNGDFVVAWASATASGYSTSIEARYFDADCGVFLADYLGNDETTIVASVSEPYVSEPDTAINANGNFAVAWQEVTSNVEFLYVYNNFVSQFLVSGETVTAQTENILVANVGSNDITSSLTPPVIAMDAGGDLVVAWSKGNSISGWNVWGQAVSRTGYLLGCNFQVDQRDWSPGAGLGYNSVSLAMNDAGGFVVAFSTTGCISDGQGGCEPDPITGGESSGGADLRNYYSPFKSVEDGGLFIPGDTNLDGYVDYTDYLNVVNNFGRPSVNGAPLADWDGNGIIDRDDYFAVLEHYGETVNDCA